MKKDEYIKYLRKKMCQCASIQAICTIHKSDKKRKLEMHRERRNNRDSL